MVRWAIRPALRWAIRPALNSLKEVMNVRAMKIVFGPMLAVVLAAPVASAGLKDYVEREDDSFSFEIVETLELGATEENPNPEGATTVYQVKMTSQTWQDIPWEHWVTIFRPAEIEHPDQAMLLINGGDNDDPAPNLNDQYIGFMGTMAKRTKSVNAIVSQIPNQPLFGDLREDQIIAYTYDKWLKGEGDDWPLLFPMAKSAVRAMDTVAAIIEEAHGDAIDEFMVTGASKRGWTSYLTAAVDDRVKAIAPIVIDTLNMPAQMPHQFATYGGYSEQVQDYTDFKLQERMATPEGKKLTGMVDPFSYRADLDMPKLIVNGTNDPYWTADSTNNYFDELVGDKHIYYQANVGHSANLDGVSTLSHFYNAMLHDKDFPEIEWEHEGGLDTLEVSVGDKATGAKLWKATSPNRDFRQSKWESEPLEIEDGKVTANVEEPEEGWVAYYVEVRYPGDLGMPYGNCTEVTIMPEAYPEEGIRTFDLMKDAANEPEAAAASN